MGKIVLNNVSKKYESGNIAVDKFNLDVQDQEFIVLVGPSGCGKSTLLRMIAGLETITAGELYIDKRLVNTMNPKDRNIAMVFQNYGLYPHMTVYNNIAFGLQVRKVAKKEIESSVSSVAKILNIEHLLTRKPRALSGGERQRVALGRAMVRNPVAFLLDEPLSNLDTQLRNMMRVEITRLHKRLGAIFIYVTHDQTEAMTMGDRIIVMKDGIIQQIDTPQNIYNSPINMFVASFMGMPSMNFITGTLSKEDGNYFVNTQYDRIPLSTIKDSKELDSYLEKMITLGIRPEHLSVKRSITINNQQIIIQAQVEIEELVGSSLYLHVNYYNQKLIAEVAADETYNQNTTLGICLDPEKIILFDSETERAIKQKNKKGS